MPSTEIILAVDCGAESGRVMAAELDADARRCALHEVHRFPNGGRFVDGVFTWDWRRLQEGIEEGLRRALRRFPAACSLGIDTWGVDFGLLDEHGELLGEPVHHRDERGLRHLDGLDRRLPPAERFRATGIRQMPINTLDQLHALAQRDPAQLQRARRLVFAPDLLARELCGVTVQERSIASSSSCYAPGAAQPADELLRACGIPTRLFGPTVPSGSELGPLLPAVVERLGVPANLPLRLRCSAGHDTAAAVAAVPADADDCCYLSSGTWSLMGTLVDEPRLQPEVAAGGFTNELAWDGRIRLLKNIMGLWVVQECRRAFAEAGRSWDYGDLAAAAEAAAAPSLALDVDDERFLAPGTDADPMPGRVRAWYRERGQAAPDDDAGIVRAVLEGLAQAYGVCFRDLQHVTGRRFEAVHVIGGGCRNGLLNRLTAAACGVPVIAGPVEATALGNVLVQAVGAGLLDAAGLRAVAREAAEPVVCGR